MRDIYQRQGKYLRILEELCFFMASYFCTISLELNALLPSTGDFWPRYLPVVDEFGSLSHTVQ